MSVGTMVTIVLLMLVLVLGIFFIQKIFTGGSDAIDIITTELQSQAQKLFARDETARVVIIPVSREISLKRGDNPKGFAFSVRNNDIDEAEFSYQTLAQDVSKCGISFTKETAEGYLLGGSGSLTLPVLTADPGSCRSWMPAGE